MALTKKDNIVIVLSFCTIISSGLNLILGLQLEKFNNQGTTDDKETLIVGMRNGPTCIDPVDSTGPWGYYDATNDVIRQVAEPLWYYNLTDINMGCINMLAESEQWLNTTALSVILREGVGFHDGTPFNAEAVKWNIDRMLYLTNSTGQIPSYEREASSAYLYKDPLGNPLIAGFEITGTYSGIIHLAQPFSSLMNLMCHHSFVMLSPTSHTDEEHSFIDLSTGDLVGTGPFKYEEYIVEQEVRFSRWDNYWQGPTMFREMKFKIIDDEITLNYELLAGKIDYVTYPKTDFFETFKSNSKVSFYEHQKPGLRFGSLNFNIERIDATWRKAMSYAFNYTYIIEDYFQSRVVRSYCPISPGFGRFYDPKIVKTAPYYNLTIARQTIIDDPRINTTGLTANDDPDDENWLNADLASFNYSYNTDDKFRSDLFLFLEDCFDAIGITVNDMGTDWATFACISYDLELYWAGWDLYYFDPIGFFIQLYSGVPPDFYLGPYCRKLYPYDVNLVRMINNSTSELNETLRIEIYNNISYYLVEELFPQIFVYHPKVFYVFAADLYDVPYNSFEEFYAYPINRNLTYYSINAT